MVRTASYLIKWNVSMTDLPKIELGLGWRIAGLPSRTIRQWKASPVNELVGSRCWPFGSEEAVADRFGSFGTMSC